MAGLGVLKRSAAGSRRRGVQRRLKMTTVEAATVAAPTQLEEGPSFVRPRRPRRSEGAAPIDRTPPPPVFHPLAYRSVIAAWSIEARERWGRRANDLEDAGLSWRDAETQAFVEVWNHLRRAGRADEPDRTV